MADDLAAQRAKNSAGFVGEHPPATPEDPLIGSVLAANKRLNHERVKENQALEDAQRQALGQRRAPKAARPLKAPRRHVSTPKNGE